MRKSDKKWNIAKKDSGCEEQVKSEGKKKMGRERNLGTKTRKWEKRQNESKAKRMTE